MYCLFNITCIINIILMEHTRLLECILCKEVGEMKKGGEKRKMSGWNEVDGEMGVKNL